jgi:hypothetical protein
MEASCDAEMNEIISEVRALLKESGQSSDLADTMQDAYNTAKKLKKADYINTYM